MTFFSVVAGLIAGGLALPTTRLRERYRHGRMLKVSGELPGGWAGWTLLGICEPVIEGGRRDAGVLAGQEDVACHVRTEQR